MPTATFFRLPEEKRMRLVEASWAEISQVRFSDVSINRIIAAARIPRGSFYQYFEDKDDLVRYLLEDLRQYFITLLRDILVEAEGDLFDLPLMAYDRFIHRQGEPDPMLALFIKLLTLNKGLDLQSFMGAPQGLPEEQQCFLSDPLWEVVDPSRLRRGDREYAEHVFHMACAVLAYAIVETLQCPARTSPDPARVRERIKQRIDLLRYGGASGSYKEESV